jgi:hypothetical protein
LAGVEDPVDDFPARDGYRLATSRIQEVFAMEVPASAWATGKGPGIDPTHPPDVDLDIIPYWLIPWAFGLIKEGV